jgi:hypothetical protein
MDKPIPTKGHEGTLATLVRTCGLIDPLQSQHSNRPPPPTYNRGQDRIDFIFVSTALLPYVNYTGIFPYDSVFMSDHRPCYVDFETVKLFGETTPNIDPPQYRGLRLEDPSIVKEYQNLLINQLQYHKILEKSDALLAKATNDQWSPELVQVYEALDRLTTEAMLMAEKKVSKKVSKTYQWSPSLSAAIYTLSYWKLRLSQLHGKAISSYTLQKVFAKTKLPQDLSKTGPLEDVVHHIRQARATLRQVQQNHVEMRSQHLENLAATRVLWRNPSLLEPWKEQELLKRRNKELRHIKRKEDLTRMHRKIGYTLRPGLERSGLSRVDVPTSSSPLPFHQVLIQKRGKGLGPP